VIPINESPNLSNCSPQLDPRLQLGNQPSFVETGTLRNLYCTICVAAAATPRFPSYRRSSASTAFRTPSGISRM